MDSDHVGVDAPRGVAGQMNKKLLRAALAEYAKNKKSICEICIIEISK